MKEEIIPAAPQAINDLTYQTLLPFWANNFAENLTTIRDKKSCDIDAIPSMKGEPCIIIGGGPSIKKLNHLSMIKKSGWKHPIICCDKMLADCLKNQIIPDYVGTVDASMKILGFYTSGIIRKHAPKLKAIFPIYIHPKILSTWQNYKAGPIYWFNPIIDNIEISVKEKEKVVRKPNYHSSTMLLHLLSKKSMISGIGNVGSFLWNIAAEKEASHIILVGFDFSEQVVDKAKAIWFNQMLTMYVKNGIDPEKAGQMAADMHQTERNPDFISDRDDPPFYTKGEGVGYLINPYWKNYRNLLAGHIRDSGIHTINATGGGSIHTEATDNEGNFILKVPNFEAMNLNEVLKKYGC